MPTETERPMRRESMCSCGTAEPHCVSRRKTFDGCDVELWSNGEVAFRTHFLRGKLPVDKMWRVWEDIELYTADELPTLLRSVRAGKWQPFRIRPTVDHEAILAAQVRSVYFYARSGCLVNTGAKR